MPATMLFTDHHRAQLAHRLNRSLVDTRTRARRAAQARQASQQLDQEKNQLVTANPNLAGVDVHRKTMYIFLLVCMVAVYGMDLVLFAAVAGYFVKQSFSASPRIATVAQFLVPAFIVIVEMALSMQRDAAYRDYLEGFGTRLRLWGWTALTVFCTLVMPMAVIATFLAGEGDDFAPWVSVPLIVTLAGLSLVCHVLMLCGGRLALESKSWAVFRLQMSSLQSRIRQSGRAYTVHSQGAADRFAAYLQDLNAHNAEYATARIEAGPFDRNTREVLNDAYGYEVIRTPAGNQPPAGPQATPQAPPPPNPPQNHPERDNEPRDWRNAFEREMREQEAEVRP
jgi:hypothetical protein